MNSLFFCIQHRRSLHTLRIHYGIEGMKYIVQIYEGEVNGHGDREGLPTEYQCEFEQEMLKHIHKLTLPFSFLPHEKQTGFERNPGHFF